MTNSEVDTGRRRVLIAATSAMGAAGVGAIAVPFLSSWAPSERAKAAGAPVEVNVSKLEPGQLMRVIWRGKPVWIVHRDEKSIAALPSLNSQLTDPESAEKTQQPEEGYATNLHRSINPKYFVAVGICTHLGCSPTYRPELAPADLGAEWKGGWYCPCHGSRFDLAGRVYKGVPAPTNLVVPPHHFKNENTILVGEHGGAA